MNDLQDGPWMLYKKKQGSTTQQDDPNDGPWRLYEKKKQRATIQQAAPSGGSSNAYQPPTVNTGDTAINAVDLYNEIGLDSVTDKSEAQKIIDKLPANQLYRPGT